MNIWVLDNIPSEAARYHCDRHVHGAIGELAQLLCLAHVALDGYDSAFCNIPMVPLRWMGKSEEVVYSMRRLDMDPVTGAVHAEYRLVDITHPCAAWIRESSANYQWTAELLHSLISQSLIRWNRNHEWGRMSVQWRENHPMNIPLGAIRTPFVQAIPVDFKKADAVTAYREYYFARKQHLARWTVVGAPKWWKDMVGKEVRCG